MGAEVTATGGTGFNILFLLFGIIIVFVVIFAIIRFVTKFILKKLGNTNQITEVSDELFTLNDMYNSGKISKEEYEKRKIDIINRI